MGSMRSMSLCWSDFWGTQDNVQRMRRANGLERRRPRLQRREAASNANGLRK